LKLLVFFCMYFVYCNTKCVCWKIYWLQNHARCAT